MQKNTHTIRKISSALKDKKMFSINDRIALFIAHKMAHMGVVYVFIGFIVFWIFWGEETLKDPYPFPLLLLVMNFMMLILLPLIMVGQNILNRHSENRSEQVYDATMSTYQNITIILDRLNNHEKELLHQTKMLQSLIMETDSDVKTIKKKSKTDRKVMYN